MAADLDRAELRAELADLLAYEAQLLDEHRYDEWFDLLDDAYRYVIPQVEVSEADETPRYNAEAYLVMDSKASMMHKLSRRSSDKAWAMRPPAIEHRLVGSVQITAAAGDVSVRSVVLVSVARLPEPLALYPAARADQLRRTDAGWRFTERLVHLGSEIPDATQLGVIY